MTLIREGKRIEGRSFKVGAVRLLQDKVHEKVWREMAEWCGALTAEWGLDAPLAIGAGGNINRLFKLGGCLTGETLTFERLSSVVEVLERCSYEDRLERFQLKPDRADVIVPAGRIYQRVMDMAGSKGILVPKVGLADGIILGLHAERGGA